MSTRRGKIVTEKKTARTNVHFFVSGIYSDFYSIYICSFHCIRKLFRLFMFVYSFVKSITKAINISDWYNMNHWLIYTLKSCASHEMLWMMLLTRKKNQRARVRRLRNFGGAWNRASWCSATKMYKGEFSSRKWKETEVRKQKAFFFRMKGNEAKEKESSGI